MDILILLLNPISGRLADKYGARVLSSIGLASNAAALFWFSTLNRNSTYGPVLGSLILFGFGVALFAPANASAIMGSVPIEKRGVANGIRNTISQTAGVLSIPFSLLLMTLVMPYKQLSQLVGGSQLLVTAEIPAFLKAVNHACLILGIVALLGIIPSVLRGPHENTANIPKN
jgi:MFS family permease